MKLNPQNSHEFTMTIEGRPEIDYDWKAEYLKQRKSRFEDAVHDYLDDADTSILEFYHDLQDVLVDMVTYHKTFGEKAAGALLLVHGKSVTENSDDDIPGDPSY